MKLASELVEVMSKAKERRTSKEYLEARRDEILYKLEKDFVLMAEKEKKSWTCNNLKYRDVYELVKEKLIDSGYKVEEPEVKGEQFNFTVSWI